MTETQLNEITIRVREMAALAEAGIPVPFDRWLQAVTEPGSVEAVVVCTLQVARDSGAPIAPVLTRLATFCDRLDGTARTVAEAVAGPRMARRIIVLLPFLALPLTWLLGFDSVGVLIGSPVGWALLVLATGLTWLGHSWTRRMIARAQSIAPAPGLYPRVVGIALSAGVGITRARAMSWSAINDNELDSFVESSEIDASEDFIRAAQRTGIPVTAGLVALEARFIDQCLHEAAVRVRELGEKLLIPLGVCTLPAFLCLGVVPAVISIISTTHLGA